MSTIVTRSGKGSALTHTEVDDNFTNLNTDKAAASDVIFTTQKGAASGVAPLDSTSKISSTYLPSYVDDVVEYANYAALPVTGETGKIYVALDTNKTYRWSGSAYIYITSGAVDSVAGKTGVVDLVKADVGLGNVDNTTDALKPVSTATTTAIGVETTRATTAEALLSPKASPAFTGTVTGVTATMVGLSNVTNNAQVTGVTGTAPIVSSGGAAPAISISAATTSNAGSLSSADKTKLDAISGTNTGNETATTIKNALSITTLSGSNTGDQVIPTTLPASDVSAWAKTATKPTYTATEVGLGNADNTSDANKPVSTATATSILTAVPAQTSHSGKYLSTNGTLTAWTTVDALPSQANNSGKYLTTSGTAASWATLNVDPNVTTKGLYEHSKTISANYTIGTGNNAMQVGPVTVASGASLTVPSGSRMIVL